MTSTTRWTRKWLAAVGMAGLLAVGLPGAAQADTVDPPGTGLKATQGARTAADPVGGQTNLGPRLNPGTVMAGGQILKSPSGQFNISMFDALGEGRLPLSYSRTCGWDTPFVNSGNGAEDTILAMQGDGNLVIYQGGSALWHTRTNGNPGAFLNVQNDGNYVVYAQNGQVLWNAGAVCDRLFSMENTATWEENGLDDSLRMQSGDLMFSPNRRHRLVLQTDGNLVLYTTGNRVLWHAGTNGNPGARLIAQRDGNFVLYAAGGQVLWTSRTAWEYSGPNEGMQMMLQSDGNLIIYRWNDINTPTAFVKWATNTRA